MSDRRTFLGNAAAAAVMTKISSLSSFGFAVQGPAAIDPTLSDREKAGLRGPVKTNVEETTTRGGKHSIETEYSPDGRSLTWRMTTSNGEQPFKTWTYDADGRLAKIIWGEVGEPADYESLYSYDETGRLLTISNHPRKGGRMDFQYDGQGHKTTIQTFEFEETLKRAHKGVMVGPRLGRAAYLGFRVPAGGKVISTYNDRDQQTESQVRDAEDRVVSRVVRSYDANGRMIEEKEIQENPALLRAAMARAKGEPQPPAETLEAINKQLKSMPSEWRSYVYDTEGRVIERRSRGASSPDQISRTSYNEHGDESAAVIKVDEASPDQGLFPGELEVRYTYEYDGYGNWTQQTMNLDPSSGFGEAPVISQRKLTYY